MSQYTEKYGPWALVVGASIGLGAAWAEECAKRGFHLVICARRKDRLETLSQRLQKEYGVEVRTFSVDISQEAAYDTILENIRDLDIGMCIYNAAIEHGGYFIKVEEEHHLRQIVGNAVIPMRLSWYLCRDMARKNRGCILLVSSMAGIIGTANQSSYGATKAFMAQLAETLWYEMRKYGVTVAGVTVGSVATPQFYQQQAAQGTNMEAGASYDYSDLLEGLTIEPDILKATPHTPEEVAAYVLEHVEDGPRLFSHKEDQLSYEGYNRMSRRDGCLFMGRNTDKFFSAGLSNLGLDNGEKPEEEFKEIL